MARPPYHPELRPIAPFLPRGVGGPVVVRASRWARKIARLRTRGGDVDVVHVGDAEVRLHQPRPSATASGPKPALVWLHGGGFVIGRAAQDDALCRTLADELGIVVAAVDYRLAPEHPYPAAVDDSHAALVWLASRDEVDETRVAVGGASAGAGLAASLVQHSVDRGDVRPVFQSLAYPMLDDRTTTTVQANEPAFRLWNSRSNAFGWRSYLETQPGGAGVDPRAVPARRADLTGLPPAWIGVGTLDLFHDEALAYADRLRSHGVPCDLTVVDGAFHGFDVAGARTSVAKEFRRAQLDALRRGLGIDPPA